MRRRGGRCCTSLLLWEACSAAGFLDRVQPASERGKNGCGFEWVKCLPLVKAETNLVLEIGRLVQTEQLERLVQTEKLERLVQTKMLEMVVQTEMLEMLEFVGEMVEELG
ncbi:unnamed protein product [Prunus armeniaca]